MEIENIRVPEKIDQNLVKPVLARFKKTKELRWDYANQKPLFIPNENFVCKIKGSPEIFLCEEYECTQTIEQEDLLEILKEIASLGEKPHMINFICYSHVNEKLESGSLFRLYAKFTNKTNLRSKVHSQNRSYVPTSELYSLFIQLKVACNQLYESCLYKGMNGQKPLSFLPFFSPSCIYMFGKENYKIGLSTAFKYGDNSMDKFLCPELPMKDQVIILKDECWEMRDEAKKYIAYSIGAVFIYYSTLREPEKIFDSNTFQIKKDDKKDDIEEIEVNNSNRRGPNVPASLSDFDKSGALKKQNNPNPYNSVPADIELMKDLNTKIRNMIEKRDYSEFKDLNVEDVFSQHQEIYEHTLYYQMSKKLKFGESLEVTISTTKINLII